MIFQRMSFLSFYQVIEGGSQGRSGSRHQQVGTCCLGEETAWSSRDISVLLPLLPATESWKSELQELLESCPHISSSSKPTPALLLPTPTRLPFPLPSLALSFLQQDATRMQHCQYYNCMLSAGLLRISFFAAITCHLQLTFTLPVLVQSISHTAVLQWSCFPPFFPTEAVIPPYPSHLNHMRQFWLVLCYQSLQDHICCLLCMKTMMEQRCILSADARLTSRIVTGSLSIFRHCLRTLNLNWNIRGSGQTLRVTQDL